MRKLSILLFVLALCAPMVSAKKAEDAALNYEIIGAGTGTQGTYLVEVSVLSKKKDVSDAQLVSAAVHGVLFRGFSNPAARGFKKPLAGSASNEAQHVDFYKDFFSDNGMAKNFGNVVKGTRSITKAAKEYKVSAKVSVEKESLIKYLEDAGVVRSLNAAF
ncbi:MAG: hypothetical protein HDS04_02665 [Bacteroides sp.]|nr:hypothetical protein [Bacteroides sp.]MBD5327059.1 hypothetical protein [Bacteroides sp.]